jgi:hypothetical protein
MARAQVAAALRITHGRLTSCQALTLALSRCGSLPYEAAFADLTVLALHRELARITAGRFPRGPSAPPAERLATKRGGSGDEGPPGGR